MQPIEAGQQAVGIPLDVVKVLSEDFAEEYVLALSDGFDNVPKVLGKVKERAALARRANL